MSDHTQPNNTQPNSDFDSGVDRALEQRLQQLGRDFRYPATPNIAANVRARLSQPSQPQPARPSTRLILVRAAIIILLLLCALLAVPEVRAAIRDFIQIGVVRILFGEPTPTATTPSSVIPAPTPTLISSLRELTGHTTLTGAREQFAYPIKLPAYPPDLGEPDEVFLQEYRGDFVVLVWIDDASPDRVRMTLHILSPGVDVWKAELQDMQNTNVNGEWAVWARGPYVVQIKSGNRSDYDIRQLVRGRMLIWFDSETKLTYRLESDLSLEEAIQVAESLR